MSQSISGARDAACYESYQGNYPELGAWDSVVEPGETYMVLGNSVAHLLYHRDYSVILGRATETYGVPHAAEQWQMAEASIHKLLGLCESLDNGGITLYTPSLEARDTPHFHCYESVTSPMLPAVLAQHQPLGEINLALSLQMALAQFFRRKAEGIAKPNGEMIVVLFDGEPSNRMGIVRAIADASHHVQDRSELGIGLLQVGDSPIAEGFFSLLDDDLRLAGAAHDLVKFRKISTLAEDSLTEFLTQIIMD